MIIRVDPDVTDLTLDDIRRLRANYIARYRHEPTGIILTAQQIYALRVRNQLMGVNDRIFGMQILTAVDMTIPYQRRAPAPLPDAFYLYGRRIDGAWLDEPAQPAASTAHTNWSN